LLAAPGIALFASVCIGQQLHELRVCADPNNMPYSNQKQQGFENRVAQLIGQDLHEPVTYVWFRQNEKFFKQTLNAGVCDVVMGVPTGFDEAATTLPYYRSTYVFLSRSDRHLRLTGLDDPHLRSLKIGVHVLGDQDDSVPPVHALISRGIVHNLVGFSIFGTLDEANPAADLIKAVADGKVDVAVAWGPLAGYFAHQSVVALDVTPILGDPTLPDLPFHFDIALGVREGDHKLQEQLNEELTRRRPEIQQILNSYGVPQVVMDAPPTSKAHSSASVTSRVAGAHAKGD
jgi:quinoprotein dehydrogenase-associated probable ABC transporter substrate-binding protein